jgi:hypothetical protein
MPAAQRPVADGSVGLSDGVAFAGFAGWVEHAVVELFADFEE